MSQTAVTAPGASRATAWAQVVTLSLTEITSWGILYYSFPVFLGPMERDLRWSQAAITGAFSLALLISGLMALPVGRWLDHARSPRALMTLGSLLGAAALVAWGGVTSLPVFYALWIALGVAMAATLYEPAFTTVAAWFPRRERALTVLTTIGGLASVIYLPVTALLVEWLGWREALLALAGVVLMGAALPHALALRPYSAAMRTTSQQDPAPASVRANWRAWRFWQLVAGFALAQVAISALIVYLIPYLSQRGMPATQAASASGLIGVTALVGRVFRNREHHERKELLHPGHPDAAPRQPTQGAGRNADGDEQRAHSEREREQIGEPEPGALGRRDPGQDRRHDRRRARSGHQP